MYSILRIASLMAFIGYAQADFAVGTSASQMGIGEIVPDTGGDIYNTDDVAVSYPGGCLDNVQQFECVSERCLIEGFFEIRGKKTEDQYGFNWNGEGWEFSQNSEILGFCTKNDDEGCTKTGPYWALFIASCVPILANTIAYASHAAGCGVAGGPDDKANASPGVQRQ
ncbi:hypothetical protein FMUND_12997 [Fusarium mundagurra]|uniref:Uncharacterized protein n=1 Tax=Fusarium mundagurra TaxID=1567541 RepID=A0A8H5XZZ2_9HYPO|nr:hypothetical protein FMUND_12997 [Fusarium mundagurra]